MDIDNIEDIYPLSPMQQGMLFHSLAAPESGEYFQQMAWTFLGHLEIPAFEQAWQQVIARHAVLRTDFDWEELEDPAQIVYRNIPFTMEHQDWRGLSVSQQQERFEKFLRADQQRRFDLATAPLLRLTLIQMAEKVYQFLWSYHHILLDGWSVGLILKELLTFYEALSRGQSLPPTNPQSFRDFIAWLQQQDLAKAEAFWRQTLKGFAAPTSLPIDHSPGAATLGQMEAYEQQQIVLPREMTQALQTLARQQQVTFSTLVHGIWGLLLSRYSGEDEVLFGATVSGRPADLPGVETMVGMFINTLPMCVQVRAQDAFASWLKQIQAHQLERLQYEYSPLVKVQQWSAVPQRQPLFENILVFENYPVEETLFQCVREVEIRDIRMLERTNYPLTLEAIPGPELTLRMIYNSRRFEASAIMRLLGHLQVLLENIVADPSQRLSALSILTPAERGQMLVDWNATRKKYSVEQCFHQLFEAQVERAPEAIALVFEDQQLTYRELNRRANQLAHYLKKLGVGPEMMVGVCLERSPEMLIALLGILKAGGAYVPLDPGYPAERIAYVLADAQVPMLLTQRSTALTLASTISNYKSLCLDTDWPSLASESAANLDTPVETENLAYTIYTSGSTGKPKGVNISQRALVNFLMSMCDAPGFTAQDTLLAVTTLSFDIAGLELYLPLLTGGRVLLASREDAVDGNRLLQALAEFSPTVMQATPATWRMLIENGWAGVRDLKILCGGEAMPRELATQLLERSAELWNMYGPTETTIWSTLDRIENREGALTIGRPIANTQVYLLDRHLQPVPLGIHGALYIGGDGLARGYFKRPDLTAEKFIPNVYAEEPGTRIYHTGDLARYLASGKIDCLGRVDQQVKIRGFRIELGEIEAVCAQHPQVEQAVVMVRDAPSTGLGVDKRLVAYLVSRAEQQATTKEVRQLLTSQLPGYMMPTAFVFLEALPLTPNGKVDRRALPAPELNGFALPDTFVAPQAPVEKILAGIWRQVLGVERIGIHDNFFELGGHSLLATQVNSRLRKILGLDFPLRTLFEAPTVAAFSQIVTARFGNNGKLERIAQLLEKMSLMSDEEKKRLLEQERHKKILE